MMNSIEIIFPTKKLSHIKVFLRKGIDGYHQRLNKFSRWRKEKTRYSLIENIDFTKKGREANRGKHG